MYSGSFLYQYVLVPLAIFGTTSVCLAFVLLLPGVGNALAVIWTLVTGDWLYQRRKAAREGTPQ
ncbi:MAG: hypothetical protein ACOZNI_16825 [Myxococcota bacterium]